MLRGRVERWLQDVDDELREPLEWTFAGTQKHFRPLTLFACDRAIGAPAASAPRSSSWPSSIELVHNMSLIIDDILDESASGGASPRSTPGSVDFRR